MEIVRNARIEDDGDALELDSATLALTQKDIGDSVHRMLESTPALLGEDAIADLRKILGPVPTEDDGQPERRSDASRLERAGPIAAPVSAEAGCPTVGGEARLDYFPELDEYRDQGQRRHD